MAVFVLSYDLRNPQRDYSRLYARLSDWDALRIVESGYVVSTNDNESKNIRDDLLDYIDSDDGLFVAKLTGQAAWQKVLCSDQNLKKKLNS